METDAWCDSDLVHPRQEADSKRFIIERERHRSIQPEGTVQWIEILARWIDATKETLERAVTQKERMESAKRVGKTVG